MFQFGLMGYPVKYSLSPWIHEHFLKLASLTGTYQLYEINPNQQFDQAVNNLKKHLDGFNITVPYKETIIPHLDKLDQAAQYCQAVNTVSYTGDQWKGYNTDGIGYVRSLETEYPHLFSNDQKVLIIGAGGAARGIYFALATKGFTTIDLANRTISNAEQIAKNQQVQTQIHTLNHVLDVIDTYDLIIQTTSVGMKPNDKEAIIHLPKLKENAVVSDIVYQPIYTSFLKRAKELGAHLHFGHTMLLYQAVYAFEIWTGREIELKNLDIGLKNVLQGD